MTDTSVVGALGADGSGAPAGGGGDQQQQQQQAPAWMEGLPADSPLRSHGDLLLVPDVPTLAKNYVDTRAFAKGRVAIPDWSNPEQTAEFGQRIRPADAAAYNIEVPEGGDTSMADAYRQFAFDTGVPAPHAEATAKFFNRVQGEALSKMAADNTGQLKALEIEHGPEGYARRIEAVQNMLTMAGVETNDVAMALQHFAGLDKDGKPGPGAGKALAALFTLAEKTGELEKVDPTDVSLRMGKLTPEAATAEKNRLLNDQSEAGKKWMAQAKIEGTPEHKRWKDIARAMAGG